MRRKAHKPSKSARKRPAKRTLTKAIESKRPAKAKLKGGAKKVAQKSEGKEAAKRARG